MKKLITVLCMLTMSSISHATNLSATETAPAQIIVRQVLEKNLLNQGFQKRHQVKRLQAILEGSESMKVEIRSFSCEKSAGTFDCAVEIYSHFDNVDGLEMLTVRTFQGNVLSADMDAI